VSWEQVALEDVAKVVGGSTPRRDSPSFWNGDIPWLTPTDLPPLGSGVTKITDTAGHITEEGFRATSLTLLPPSTVVFSSRATIGKVGVAEVPITTNQGFVNLIPNERIYPRYLAWVLFHHADRLAALSGSTTFKEVSRTSVKRFRIPLPPLDEQRRIAHLLDVADRLRHRRTEANEKAQRVLPALFVQMFGDPETNPMGWETAPLSEVLEDIETGWSPTCLDRPAGAGEWSILKLGAVSWNWFDDAAHKALPTTIPAREHLEVAVGDILMSRKNTRDLVGASVLVDRVGARRLFPDLMFRLRPSDRVDSRYLWAALQTPSVREQIRERASGSAASMCNVSQGRLKEVKVMIPPLQRQRLFGERTTAMAHTRRANEHAGELLAHLSATLGSRLFAEAM
jgi:type I restriction enzyme, S subunit